MHNQSVCLHLFSVLGERDSFTGTSVPPVEAFSAIPFFPPLTSATAYVATTAASSA